MRSNGPKRQEILPLKRIQLKLVACVCFPLIISSLAVSIFQTYFFLSTLRNRSVLQTEYAQEIIPIAFWVTAIVVVVLITACFMVSIIVGHRLVGPIGRFTRRFEEMSKGIIRTGFTFRDKDDLAFLATAFGKFETRLYNDLVTCQTHTKQLLQATEKLKSYEISDEAAEAALELESAVQAIGECISTYDLGLDETNPTSEKDDGGKVTTEDADK